MNIKCFISCTICLVLGQYALAEDFPFELPNEVSASISIDSSQQEKYNNDLLGTNIFKFESATDKALIEKFNPFTIRFPHGLWANWYDWEADHTRLFGDETVSFTNSSGGISNRTVDHLASIRIFENSKTKIGIEGLTDLNTVRKDSEGGYDMVWTFNMSADGTDFDNGSPVSVARYQDLINRGFEVKDIEMGNENFYPGQRSSIIPNTSDYIARAKSMSKALKKLNPNLQLSIPLLRRENSANPSWNEDLTQDKDYFDAVTVHTYVGSNPDDATTSDLAFGTALTARHHIANSVDDYSKKVAPNKPIWLTEWGVKSGGPNAASVLGMADSYLFMSENQNTYHRANWFSVNGKLNSFVVWEEYVSASGVVRPRIKYPLEKTTFGAAHEIIRSILQDSVLLDSNMTAPELMNGVNAISARSVVKNDKVVLFVLNMTNKSAPFNIHLDGQEYSGGLLHHGMIFDSLDEERVFPIDQSPLDLIYAGTDKIVLPKLSLNKIVLTDTNIVPEIFEIEMTTQSEKYAFDAGSTVQLEASTMLNEGNIESVIFSMNDMPLATVTSTPFIYEWTANRLGTHQIKALARKTDGKEKASTMLVNVTGDVVFDVAIDVPSATSLELGQTLTLSATASTNLGKIESVSFRANETEIHQSITAPFSFEWKPDVAGSYEIKVVATKVDQSIQTSLPMTISVTATAVPTPTPTPAPTTPSPNTSSESGGGTTGLGMLWLMALVLSKRYCRKQI